MSVDTPITFKKAIKFNSGELVVVDLDYEKLSKLCFRCKRLTHDQYHCRDKTSYTPHPAQLGQSSSTQARSDINPLDLKLLSFNYPEHGNPHRDPSFTNSESEKIKTNTSGGRRGRGRPNTKDVYEKEKRISNTTSDSAEGSVFNRLGPQTDKKRRKEKELNQFRSGERRKLEQLPQSTMKVMIRLVDTEEAEQISIILFLHQQRNHPF